ncbi:hypothetical protein HFO24_04995 [Rhizobium laguerreae]|uniref:DUF6641 family protein n=1 Tax=Rhizobium laguerreae TaxID=1076926 RepID=UPI001C90882C|nr:DUF6641 family protein [Rhizobium laguerreae]MBY3181028.1 hypothetical protein [Rhizobium laguerreae]
MSFENMKLVAAKKKAPLDAAGKRRARLLHQINKQIDFASKFTPARAQRGRWFQQEPDGSFTLSIRYGRRDLELSKGKFAISCTSTDELIKALEAGRLHCSKGQFDEQLERISGEIRTGFRRS